ncbi:brevican core protein [Bombina bombina]|uniref:brevican core protein n=1 Tax=Bombina bombina TaxID=8345 RepID=UPI00235ADF6D|nr:brevican core protein [Bombina bombina]
MTHLDMSHLVLSFLLTSLLITSTFAENSAEDHKTLKVTIGTLPSKAVLAGTLTIPCHITNQSPLDATNVGRRAVLAMPRVKWSFMSDGKEVEILVARGHKVKISEAYRYRASLPYYSSSDNNVTLVLKELRTNDSGIYRCYVQHGIEDNHDTIEVKVKGVVFLYREGTTRYAYTFSMAQEACSKIKAHIATADQLLAAYHSGYEQCDAGWIADQTVRYPIQTPREGCYGDMDGYPGVRNYGVLDPDDMYDVYCYVEELNGEVFLGSMPNKLTFADAQTYCRYRGSTVATTGELYAAWSDGLDYCSPGWLSDGSVRYPIVTPSERCGGNTPGVKTIFQFRNQTGFPDTQAKYDVYCFKEKGLFSTQSPEDNDVAAGVGTIITVTESFEELKLSEVKGENEAQGFVDSLPLNKTSDIKRWDEERGKGHETTTITQDHSTPQPHLQMSTSESAISHKDLAQPSEIDITDSNEEDSSQDFREEDLPMEFTTELHQDHSLDSSFMSIPENQTVSFIQEKNGRMLEASPEIPTEFTPGDLDEPFVNLETGNDHGMNNFTDSTQNVGFVVSEMASQTHKPYIHKEPYSISYSGNETQRDNKSFTETSINNNYISSVLNSHLEMSTMKTMADPTQRTHDFEGQVELVSDNLAHIESETQIPGSVSYTDDFQMFPVTMSDIPSLYTSSNKFTPEVKDFESSGYGNHGVFTGELLSGSTNPIHRSLDDLVTSNISELSNGKLSLLSDYSDISFDMKTLEARQMTTATPDSNLISHNRSKSYLEDGSGEIDGSAWTEQTVRTMVDINSTHDMNTTIAPLLQHPEDTTTHHEMTQFTNNVNNSSTLYGRNHFDLPNKLPGEQERSTVDVSHLKSPYISADVSTLKGVQVEQTYTHTHISTTAASMLENLKPKTNIDPTASSFYTELSTQRVSVPPTIRPRDTSSHNLEKTPDANMSLSATDPLPAVPTEKAILGASINTSDHCFPNPCENGGTCIEDDDGDFSCLCLPGYLGKLCDTNIEKCLDDWDTFQGFCYKHFHTRKSWEDAETHCRDYGGHLASIMTPEEQDFVNNKYREYQWTGLNDRTIEGDFQWSDGNPLLYESWNHGQPDSYFLSGENCVVMVWHDGGRWSDVPCNYHLPYTCKMGLVSCGAPPEVANATTYGRPKIRYQINSVVGYRCQDGFIQRNSPIVRCQTDGFWEDPQINCISITQ